jgi:hypothetical protein
MKKIKYKMENYNTICLTECLYRGEMFVNSYDCRNCCKGFKKIDKKNKILYCDYENA